MDSISSHFSKIIRAALVIPPIKDFYFTPHRFSNLGINIVSGILENAGLISKTFNFPETIPKGNCIPLPLYLNHLKPFIIENETGKVSYFTKYKQFGPPADKCAAEILSFKPDICFISCFAFCYGETSLELAESIKRISPDLPVVLGGAGVSANPLWFLKNTGVDYVLTGEAEIGLESFLCMLKGGLAIESIPNLGWKENGGIRFSSVNKFSDSHQIETPFLITHQTKSTTYVTTSISRGCSHKCKFCSNYITHGDKYRSADFINISNSLNKLSLEPGDKRLFFNFEDDNLLNDYELLKNIIEKIKSRFNQASFLAENGIDYRMLSEHKITELIKSGMAQFNFTLGSVDKTILQKENREFDFDKYERCLNIAYASKVPVITYFICGFSNETTDSLSSTLAYLSNKRSLIGISLFYPIPGIQGFSDKSVFDSLSPALCAGSSAYPWNNSISTQTMITAFRLTRFCNLLKAEFHSDVEKELINKILSTRKLHTIIKEKGGEAKIIEVPRQDTEFIRLFFNKNEFQKNESN